MDSSDIAIIENPETIDAQRVINLLASVGFGEARHYTPEGVEAMLRNSTYVAFGIAPDGQLAGMIRALSDGTMTTWISEIIVAPQYQRRGLGGRLLNCVQQRYQETAIYAEGFVGQEKFFEGNGIKPRPIMFACAQAPVGSAVGPVN